MSSSDPGLAVFLSWLFHLTVFRFCVSTYQWIWTNKPFVNRLSTNPGSHSLVWIKWTPYTRDHQHLPPPFGCTGVLTWTNWELCQISLTIIWNPDDCHRTILGIHIVNCPLQRPTHLRVLLQKNKRSQLQQELHLQMQSLVPAFSSAFVPPFGGSIIRGMCRTSSVPSVTDHAEKMSTRPWHYQNIFSKCYTLCRSTPAECKATVFLTSTSVAAGFHILVIQNSTTNVKFFNFYIY